MMKKIAYFLGGLLVLLLVAAVLAPAFVDLNDYKPLIAAEVKKATGRDLAIDGSIDLALLPSPRVSIENVRLGNIPGAAAPDMIALESVEAAVAFGALLQGKIQVTSITLVQPVVTLERLADGSANWQFAPPGAAAAEGEGGGGGIPIALDNVVVDGGTLIYRDAAQGFTYQADQIDAIASARSLQGPFALTGTFVTEDRKLAVDAKIGDLGGAALPVSLAVSAEGAGSVSFSGSVKALDAVPEVNGTVEAGGDSLAAALAVLAGGGAPSAGALARPFTLKGTLAASEKAVAVNDMTATLGDVRATGALNVVPGAPLRVDGAISVNQVDLDTLLGGDAAAEGQETAPSEPTALALPTGIVGAIDATVDAVVFRGEVVRQVHVSLALDEGALTINQATALLPGGSDVSVFGIVAADGGTAVFDGQIEAASDDLRALFRWLGADVAGVPEDRLRKFSFAGAVRATSAEISIRDGDLRFDTSRLTGAIDVALAAPLRVTADVALDKLNLDAYLAPADPAAEGGGAGGVPTDIVADVKARVDHVTFRGVAVQGLVIDGIAENGRLTLRQLAAADVGGASVEAQGLVDPAGGAYDLTLGVDAKDIGGLARLAGIALPIAPEALGAVAIEGTFKGDAKAVAVDAGIRAAPANVRAQGTVGGLPDAPVLDLALSGDVSDLAVLLAGAGVAPTVDLAAFVPFSFKGAYKGDFKAADVTLDATAPPGTLSLAGTINGLDGAPGGDLKLSLAGSSLVTLARAAGGPDLLKDGPYGLKLALAGNAAKATLDATLAALGGTLHVAGEGQDLEGKAAFQGTIDLDHPEVRDLAAAFAPAQPDTQPLGPLDLTAAVRGDATAATLSNLVASLGASAVTGEGNVSFGTSRPTFQLALAAGELVLDPFLGSAPGDQAAAPVGEHEWSSEPLDLSALRAADGTATLKAKAIVAGAYRLDGADIQLALKDGVLTIQRLAGNTFGGALQATGSLAAGEVNGTDLDLRLTGVDMRRLLAETAGYDDLSGRLDFALKADAVGASERELVRNLAGDAQVEVHDGVVEGYDLTAFSQRLGQLDNIAGLTALAGTALSGGQTHFTEIAGTFAIDKGVARSDDLHALMDGAQLNAVTVIDLPQWRLTVDGQVALSGYQDLPQIGFKMRGPLDQPKATFDTKAMAGYVAKNGIGTLIKTFGNQDTQQLFDAITGEPLSGGAAGVLGGAAAGAAAGALGGATEPELGAPALPVEPSGEAALPTAEPGATLPAVEEPVVPEAAVPPVEEALPVEEVPAEAEEPALPAAEEPVVPEAAVPPVEETLPAEEVPAEAEEPAVPEVGEAVPESEEPALPVVEEPALPAAEEPALPEAEEPALPTVEEPVAPEVEEALPQAEEPVLPEAEEPALPAEEEPLPAAEEPLPPAEEEALPSAEEPALPTAEEPALPEGGEALPPAEGDLPEALPEADPAQEGAAEDPLKTLLEGVIDGQN